jgi:hypothetical protein
VWPSINSHILEGLTMWAERGNKKAQKLAGELLKKTVSMISGAVEGGETPNSFEHYNPETGFGSNYRGVHRFLNSFMLDNVFRIAGGFAIRYGEIQDDPILPDQPDFKLQGMPLGNKLFDVERKNGRLKVTPH